MTLYDCCLTNANIPFLLRVTGHDECRIEQGDPSGILRGQVTERS